MSVFDKIKPTTVRRSKFDLSHKKLLTMDMGQLIPIMCKEVAPNDVWKIGNESVIRFQPMYAPVMAEINATVHYFFVPTRFLMKDNEGKWSNFISGGKDGNDATQLPTWNPSTNKDTFDSVTGLPVGSAMYSLWDYLGLKVGLKNFTGKAPLAFGKRAYNKIYNDWYRDPMLQQDEIDLDSETIQFRNLKKDYFVSASIRPQLGTAPNLPFDGKLPLMFTSGNTSPHALNEHIPTDGSVGYFGISRGVATGSGSTIMNDGSGSFNYSIGPDHAGHKVAYTDASLGVSANVNDLRTVYAIQRFMERNNVAGGVDPSHYGDFLRAHWGIAPSDIELNRAQYIGGSRNPVLVGEIAQTSQSTANNPLGKLSGNGTSAGRNFVCNFRAKEFGYIVGILSIMPNTVYPTAIERQWLKYEKQDFLIPEFAELGETEVYTQELFPTTDFDPTNLNSRFGYQGMYDEYRSAHDVICGGMDTPAYDYWNLSRRFANAPTLSAEFISGKWLSTDLGKRIFATSESDIRSNDAPRAIIVNFFNACHVVRCLPYYPL